VSVSPEETVQHPAYGLTRELPGTAWEAAVDRTIAALQTEGFGILTRIDVHNVMKAKLDVDLKKYVILGACNPPLAYQALLGEPWAGLLLPCNVVVTENDDGAVVSIASPKAMFAVANNAGMAPLAAEAEQRLIRALERI
jgi:uncharacterized protein (DUF302 family)